MNFNREITNFLEYIEYNKRYSADTLKSYKYDLLNFAEWVANKKIKKYDDITFLLLREYMRGMKHLSARTINRKTSSLCTFFKFLCTEGICQANNALLLNDDKPAIEETIPNIVSNDDVDKMIDFCRINYCDGRVTNYRDYAMLMLFAKTGIRRVEITNILHKDIDFDNQCVKIRGKGNKERKVYLNEEVVDILKNYINNYRPKIQNAHLSDFVFISQEQGSVSTQTVNRAINKIMKKVGCYEAGRSCHTLRKSKATNTYAKTHDIYVVAEMLGHKNINTTRIYARQQEGHIKEAFLL